MPNWPIRVYSQNTPSRCWEACARSMWHYRYFGHDNGYTSAIGGYAQLDHGLFPEQMNNFYCGLLHLESTHNPTGADLRHRLDRGPVILFTAHAAVGHAMVAAGYGESHYTIGNPYHAGQMNFDDGGSLTSFTAQGRLEQHSRQSIDNHLGEYIWYWGS